MRKRLFLLLCAIPGVGLLACASAPIAPDVAPPRLFQDERFAPPTVALSVDEVFALNDGMREFLSTRLSHNHQGGRPANALIDALYRKDSLKLEYDGSRTRNAREAYDARAGNCLSLVLMTAAFAKEMGLRITYQSADIEDFWE